MIKYRSNLISRSLIILFNLFQKHTSLSNEITKHEKQVGVNKLNQKIQRHSLINSLSYEI